ncbi:hypothetical protein VM1G_11613 [Cytospora mali]|uniref:Uncharacterized protein n=1 Tax=Cytospora mali TaxID=578113 RepID=A0A194W0F8_CYTMA|nr:hypothetical protein VM1G_11613 [Valsa mali]
MRGESKSHKLLCILVKSEACHTSQWDQYAANRNHFVWTVSTRSEWVPEASNMHTAVSNEWHQMNMESLILHEAQLDAVFWATSRFSGW